MQLETNARMLAWIAQTFGKALERSSDDPVREAYSKDRINYLIPAGLAADGKSLRPIVRALSRDGRALRLARLSVEE